MRMKTTDRSATYDGACEKTIFSLRFNTLAGLHCMVLFLRGPEKRSGLIRYGSGKDIGFKMGMAPPIIRGTFQGWK